MALALACAVCSLAFSEYSSAATSTSTSAEADSELWSEIDLIQHLSSDVALTGVGVLWTRDGLRGPTIAGDGGGAILDIKSGSWTFSQGYLWVRVRGTPNGPGADVRFPLISATYEAKWDPVTVSDRNRVDQLAGTPGNPVRYRNRLMVDRSLSTGRSITDIFASEEIFYNLTADRWIRSRTQIGITMALNEDVKIQLYYLLQHDRYSAVRRVNVLGTAVQITF